MPLPAPQQTTKLELLQSTLGQPVVIAYGRHISGGNVVFENENTDGTVSLFIAHGEGEWDAAEKLWVNGEEISVTDTTKYHFHPGLEGQLGLETAPATRNQFICSFFPAAYQPQLTFNRTCYSALKIARDPTAPGPSFDVRGHFRTLRVRDFDGAAFTAYNYSKNPARCALDLLMRRFLMPHGLVNEAPPGSVTSKLDFAAWSDWKDYCDVDLTINSQVVDRWEAHPALVDETDLLRALELLLLLGRAYLLEKNGKFTPYPDQARASQLTAAAGDILSESLTLSRRTLRDAANSFLFKFRILDSGATANDPKLDFQQGEKEAADEDHQDQIGRINRSTIDLGNSTFERAERTAEYTKRRTLDLTRQARFRLAFDTPGAIDLLPGDVLTAPDALDYPPSGGRQYEILEISDEPDGSRDIFGLEYSTSVFVDTAGPQQQLAQAPVPGTGIAGNAPRMPNVLGNAGFFRAGVAGQEGTDRPKFWKQYSNTGGAPAVPGEVEHLLADDRIKLKTKTATTDKIGARTLWKNLGLMFKPANYVIVYLLLRHTGASGTYDKAVKAKIDSDAQTYTQSDGSKFDATIPAGTIGNTFAAFYRAFQLRGDVAVPNALNVFVWSEATNASKANEDLEIDEITMASGRIFAPFVGADEIRDADIVWDAGTGLYTLPDYVVKGQAPAADSGGSGGSGGGGGGFGGCIRSGQAVVGLSGQASVRMEPWGEWIEIRMENGITLEAVPQHRIYTNAGERRMEQLEPGELVVTRRGLSAIKTIRRFGEDSWKMVVETEGHLYWANDVLSHNLKPLEFL